MYIVIRKYQSSDPSEVFHKIQQGFVPLIKSLPGFIDYYVFKSGDNEVVIVNMFDGEANGQSSTHLAKEWVEQNIAHLYSGPPQIFEGETEVTE